MPNTTITAPVIAGLAAGIAFIILFSTLSNLTTTPCPNSVNNPHIRLSINEQDEYVTSEGTFSGRCIEPVFDYVQIIDIGTISKGSKIVLSVEEEEYQQPDNLKITIQNAGIFESELKKVGGGGGATFLVENNIPSGNYALVVQANWNNTTRSLPIDGAMYLFSVEVN